MLTRRRFLSNGSALGVSLSMTPWGNTASALTARELPGYKALVCIFLAGGNDSFNMLVPTDAGQFDNYRKARGNLALSRACLLDLPGHTANDSGYGLHSGMPELRELYARGDAAFLANVGTLRKSFNASDGRSKGASLPKDLLTHSGQMDQWQSCLQEMPSSSGWAGRMADVLQPPYSHNAVSMSLSMSGTNTLQLGEETSPCSIDVTSATGTSNMRLPVGVDFNFVNRQMAERAESSQSTNLKKRRAAIRKSTEAKIRLALQSAQKKLPDIQSGFSSDSFSRQLATVAQIIAARNVLNSPRQTFYVSFSGWDHHHQLLSSQGIMLPVLSQGLQSFRDVLVALGVFDEVTTFTVSEFGRSLTSNGSGSDHGWGGHQIVMGGAVTGSKIHGSYPELSRHNPLNIGDGIYAPTTSNEQYFAELALWMGVPRSQLDYVLPRLRAFRAPADGIAPLKLFTS